MHGIAAGASLTLAMTHFVLSLRSEILHRRRAFMASTIMALFAAGAIYFELEKSLSTDVESYLAALEGDIVCVFVMVMALLNFVRLYFRADANVLFLVAIALWVFGTGYAVINFPAGFYSDIGQLIPHQTSWGETYVKLQATTTPLKWTTDLGTVLVIVFIITTSAGAWKRGQRQQALVVGGSGAGFLLVAGILVPLDDVGLLRTTMPVGLSFVGIVAALTYLLISDQIQATRLRLEIEQLRRGSLAGEIAAGLMHELRQPLTSILSNSQAARRFLEIESPDLKEVREAIDDIVAEDKRAAGIISGLRTFLGQETLETSDFDLNSAVKGVARLLSGEFNTNGTRLVVIVHPAALIIHGSRIQIEQVIVNLSMNALRALMDSDDRERVVRLSTARKNGHVELSISDSGPGIAADMRDRLFEPFTSGSDGLGMGLAICKRIVDSHEGTIRIEDSDLGGACFAVVLPMSEPQES